MDYEVARIMSDPDWYEKYHSYIRLQGRTAYIKEMLADNQWIYVNRGLPWSLNWNWPATTSAAFNCLQDGKWKRVDYD